MFSIKDFIHSRSAFIREYTSRPCRGRPKRLKGDFIKVRGLCATVALCRRGVAASSLDMCPRCFWASLNQSRQPDHDGCVPPPVRTLFECLQIGNWNEYHESSVFCRQKADTICCIVLVRSLGSFPYQKIGVAYLRNGSGENTAIGWELKEFVIE